MAPLRRAVPDWLEDAENGLSHTFRALLQGLWADLQGLEQRVKDLDREIEAVSEAHPDAKRLKQLRGIGPLTSTALVAQLGDGKHFKRGDPYLRCILIHGARSVVSQAKQRDDRLSLWLTDLAGRKHTNVAAVALANKTVRIAWAMLRNGTDYDPELARA